jgi:hypothetical protein
METEENTEDCASQWEKRRTLKAVAASRYGKGLS